MSIVFHDFLSSCSSFIAGQEKHLIFLKPEDIGFAYRQNHRIIAYPVIHKIGNYYEAFRVFLESIRIRFYSTMPPSTTKLSGSAASPYTGLRVSS